MTSENWIPLSEISLPKEYKHVLVSDLGYGVYIGYYVKGKKWDEGYFINEHGMHSRTAVAWQPLPKPYKIENEE